MKIGVLDIQGSVIEHVRALERAGAEVVRVKKPSDLEGLAGLVIPGGESTTIGKLLRRFGLRDAVLERFKAGDLAIYGTCAGAILMAGEIVGEEQADSLGLMDIVIERNAYGNQLDSFESEVKFDGKRVPAVFIRAPRIVRLGEGCEALAEIDGEVVAARQGKLLVSCFHPELTDDLRVHRYFLEMC